MTNFIILTLVSGHKALINIDLLIDAVPIAARPDLVQEGETLIRLNTTPISEGVVQETLERIVEIMIRLMEESDV